MSKPIPPDTQMLIDRMRHAADELESAARYGLPIPSVVSIDDGAFGVVRFAAHADEYEPWLEYAEATERQYDRDDRHWRAAEAVIGEHDLAVAFATSEPLEVSA